MVKPGRLAMSSRTRPGSALSVLVLEACLAFVWVPEIRTEVLTLVCLALPIEPSVFSQTNPSAEIMCFFVNVHACIVCVCVHVCAHMREREHACVLQIIM